MTSHEYESIIQEICELNLNEFGRAILFGSFVRTKGQQFRDIDIYIDGPVNASFEIAALLRRAGLPFKISMGNYPLPPIPKPFPILIPIPVRPSKPKPGPTKPTKPSKPKGILLHITVAPAAHVRNMPFYRNMLNSPVVDLAHFEPSCPLIRNV